MRLRLLAGLLLLASLSFAGIHTFPPSGTTGLLGSGGPRPDEFLSGTVEGEISDGINPVASAEYIICPAELTGTANGAGLYSKSGVPVGGVVVKAVNPGHTTFGTAAGTVTDGGTIVVNVVLNMPYSPLQCGSSLLDGLQAYYDYDGPVETFSADDPNYYGYDSDAAYDFSKQGSGPSGNSTAKLGRSIQAATSSGNSFFYTTNDFRQAGSFSVSFWSRCQTLCSAGQADFLFLQLGTGVASPTDFRVFQGFESASLSFTYYDSVAGSAAVSGTLTTTFKHFVFTYDSATKRGVLWQDGVAGGAGAALTNGLAQSSTELRNLHASGNDNQSWPRMDELGIWQKKLSNDEVACLFAGGAAVSYPFTGVCE